MWCVPEITAEFIERMEAVLGLYARRLDPREPVVCLDERPVVLHEDARHGQPMRPGRLDRTDYEYVRCGTANIFCIVEPLTGQRLTFATANRKAPAFVRALRKVALRYRAARRIHLVMDNLNIHSLKSVVTVLGELEGLRLWRRFEVHHTPKHASWLNAAELEASLVSRECLGHDRVSSLVDLISRVSAWRRSAEHARRTIEWKWRVDDARRTFRYGGLATQRSEH
jgi:DDE superfamily endonuclease